LTVQPRDGVIATNPAANIQDNKPGVNFQSFGVCVNIGLCIPVTPLSWKLGGKPVKIGSGAILTLTETCTLMCQVGGVIKVIDPGQSCVYIDQSAKSVVFTKLTNAQKKEEAKKILDKKLDEKASSPWVNLSWDKVKEGAKKRIDNPHSISQHSLNVCGPAVIVNALAEKDPVKYAKLVRDIFTTGKFNGIQVSDDLLNGKNPSGMEEVDWMFLSAIRDTANRIFDYEGTPSEDFSAITMPGEIAKWMKEIVGYVDTANYTSYLWGEIDNSEKVNSLLNGYGGNVIVAMLVNASRLQSTDEGLNLPDHWIRLLTPITITDGTVSFEAFTWGSSRKFSFKRDDFEDLIFEFVVGHK
jgi:hypothetical protein